MDYRKFKKQRFWRHLVSVPFVWLPLPAIVILDILLEIYHRVCFPLYGIEKVRRGAYIQIIDRNKLQYLNGWEKIGCMYCGYANGVLLYFKEITGRSEKYWCGVMHEDKPGFEPHADQARQDFSRFGDEEDFNEKYSPKTGARK